MCGKGYDNGQEQKSNIENSCDWTFLIWIFVKVVSEYNSDK